MKRILLLSSLLAVISVNLKAQNNALYFDGTNDLCTAANASALVAGSTNISITCWAYLQNPTPNTTSYDGIAGIRDNTVADFYLLHYSASTLECRFRNSAGTPYTLTGHGVTLNEWQHFAFTYDGAMLRFYRNGVYMDSIAASGTIAATNQAFYIGGLPYQTSIFNLYGKTDEVTLWNRTLSQSELPCMASNGVDVNTASGLQLYYKFDQGTAGGTNTGLTTLTDSKGNINATLTGFTLNGATSNYVQGAASITNVTGFICPNGSYTSGSNTYYAPGVYVDTLTNSNGCDSIVQVTIYQAAVDTSVTLNGNTFTATVGGSPYYQWLDCNNNNAPIAGATSRTFSPSANGSYACIVQVGSCKDTSNCHAITTVGLNELNAGAMASVQYDGSKKSVLVDFKQGLNRPTLLVSDINGRVLIQQENNNGTQSILDLQKLSSGMYFLTILDQGSKEVFRLMVQ